MRAERVRKWRNNPQKVRWVIPAWVVKRGAQVMTSTSKQEMAFVAGMIVAAAVPWHLTLLPCLGVVTVA